jgi:hypothetical protein
MQRELWDLLTHPEVPLPALASTDVSPTEIRRPRTPAKGGNKSDAPTLDDFAPAGGAGMDDGMTGGMPAMPGMPGPRGGAGGSPPGMVRPGGAGGPGRFGSMPPGAGSMPPGVGAGMPGMAGDMDSGSLAGMPPPKYKLIRFTDVNVEAGHKYRYRVKVLLHDPNHPMTGYTPPSLASLDQTVRERIRGLDASVFYVFSDWSEASPVAELPSVDQYFAGSVKQPTTSPLVPGKPPVPATTHPVGKSLVVIWDATKAVDVAAEVDVHRGSIFNLVKDVQVIHPVQHRPVELTEYAFSTNAIVADMIGGEVIPLISRQGEMEPLKAPGEMLIIDSQGKLRVQDEAEDIEGFRRFLITEPPPVAESATTDDPMESSNGFGDILDGMPMPGVGGKGKGPPGVGRPRRTP